MSRPRFHETAVGLLTICVAAMFAVIFALTGVVALIQWAVTS